MGTRIYGNCTSDVIFTSRDALNNAIEASEELNDTPFAEMFFDENNELIGDFNEIKFTTEQEEEFYSLLSDYITGSGEIEFMWDSGESKWGAVITEGSWEYTQMISVTSEQKVINKSFLGNIKIHKDEIPSNVYNEYKTLPNAIIEREGTEDEFIVFLTVPSKEVL